MRTYFSRRLNCEIPAIRSLSRVVALLGRTILFDMWIPIGCQIHVRIVAITETILVFFYYNRYLWLELNFSHQAVDQIVTIFRFFKPLFLIFFLFLVFEIFQSLLHVILDFAINLVFHLLVTFSATGLLSHQIRHVEWNFLIIFVFFFIFFNDFGG